MRSLRFALGLAIPLVIFPAAFSAPQRLSYRETKNIIDIVKDHSEKFKDNFDDDVGKSGISSETGHEMKHVVNEFKESTERLKKNYQKDNSAATSVQDVLSRAAVINRFMTVHVMTTRVREEWRGLRQELDRLALSYDLPPLEEARRSEALPPAPIGPGWLGRERRLITDIQTSTDSFDVNVSAAFAGSAYVDTQTANLLHRYIGRFKVSADRLRRSYDSGSLAIDSVSDLLQRAEPIDQFVGTHPLSPAAQQSWIRVRRDLAQLAARYDLSPAWLSVRRG